VRLRAILTDLDGTLLEPDGTVVPDARAALRELTVVGIPVYAVTSKTASELAPIMARLGLATPAGIENGAGVRHGDGRVELLATAVPLEALESALDALRRHTGVPARSLMELSDAELAALTGLEASALPAARTRAATLPLVVEPSWDFRLLAALPARPRLRLIRGNRFLHLQGDHSKADVARRLLDVAGPRVGSVVACGDAPNDAELLAAADVAVIVPGAHGANRELAERLAAARVAPLPHGAGWAAVMRELLASHRVEDAAASAGGGPPGSGARRA